MLARGVSLPPSAYEAWFVSLAHGDRELERIGRRLPAAARRLPRPPEVQR